MTAFRGRARRSTTSCCRKKLLGRQARRSYFNGINANSRARDSDMRFLPFSYFLICWNVTPTSSLSSSCVFPNDPQDAQFAAGGHIYRLRRPLIGPALRYSSHALPRPAGPVLHSCCRGCHLALAGGREFQNRTSRSQQTLGRSPENTQYCPRTPGEMNYGHVRPLVQA